MASFGAVFHAFLDVSGDFERVGSVLRSESFRRSDFVRPCEVMMRILDGRKPVRAGVRAGSPGGITEGLYWHNPRRARRVFTIPALFKEETARNTKDAKVDG